MSRFGIPYASISDNGAQFVGDLFSSLCAEYKIKFYNSTPHYPQGNGQAEASNKTIGNGIKKRLQAAKGKWAEDLHNVLWAYRTMPRQSTGQTPFSLAFDMEAVIPIEAGLPTIRTQTFEEGPNSSAIEKDLDLADERRDAAKIRMVAYQQQTAKGFN